MKVYIILYKQQTTNHFFLLCYFIKYKTQNNMNIVYNHLRKTPIPSSIRRRIHCIADFCIVPIGVETNNNEHAASVGKLVAKVVQIIESEPSLKSATHAYGTNIEGEMDVVLKVLQDCHMSLHNEHGVPRVSTTVKIGTRNDKFATLEDKINTVNKELGR